jgi:hypothetical protein
MSFVMSRRAVLRLLPALLVAALFALTLLAPPWGRASKPGPPVVSSAQSCGYVLESCASDGSVNVNSGTGITQPFGSLGGNLTSCYFNFTPPGYSLGSVQYSIVQWDTAGLAPDPTTVALRTSGYMLSDMGYNHFTVDFSPPIVTRGVPGLADPPGPTLAFDFSMSAYGSTSLALYFAFNSIAAIPSLLQYTIGQPRTPVPTPHPVAEHMICGGNDATQSLELVQCVMTANAALDTSVDLVMQRFRVHYATELQWCEVAAQFGGNVGLLEIYDGEGAGSTPPPLLRPLATASFGYAGTPLPVWATNFDFAVYPQLEADHDYWLCVHTAHSWRLYTRMLTGTESPEFQQDIGPFYRTTTADPNWQAMADRRLSFRVIGLPLQTVGVPLAARTNAGPRLRVTPNPARGAVSVRWSGAAGALWLDVYDARGRRVARGEGASGGAGEWRWSGLDQAGRTLPAGVYFLRGRDDAGRVASERVVLIR